MAETELEGRVRVVENKVAGIEAKIDMFINEMRDRDNQRAAEIRELRQDMKDMQKSLDGKIDSMGKHVRNLTVASIVGMATVTIAVISMLLK